MGLDGEIASAWVEYYLNGGQENFSATVELLEITFQDPMRAWKIVKLINAIPISDDNWKKFVDSVLAAGPIEDLLANSGDELIDAFELEAKQNERFSSQLSLLYRGKIRDEIWRRVQDACT